MQGLDPDTGAPVGRPVRLTRNAASDGQPTVSLDGKTIAFKSTRGGGPSQIYAMRAAPEGPDNRPSPLTDGPRAKGDPDWSPDGGQIAFARYEHGPPRDYPKDMEDARGRLGGDPPYRGLRV